MQNNRTVKHCGFWRNPGTVVDNFADNLEENNRIGDKNNPALSRFKNM